MDPTIILLIFLIILSSFFSGAETALISLSKGKVLEIVKKKMFSYSQIQFLKSNPNKLLITILIGNNLVNIGTSVLATTWATKAFGDEILGIITGVLTLLILIFGEIIPKTFAQKHSTGFSSIIAKPLYLIYLIIFPITWILEKLLHLINKIFGVKEGENITTDEMKAIFHVGNKEGVIDSERQEMLENVLDFGDATAETIMTDKAKICYVDGDLSIEKGIDFFVKNEFSRMPILNGKNKVDGIITLFDLMKFKDKKNAKVSDINLRKAIFTPETKNIFELLKEFKWAKSHMAIIIDEFGETSGIVTMEDILEEVFGEIMDETDEDEDKIIKLNNNSWKLNGDIEIEKINKFFNINIEIEDHRTISYFLLKEMQKIPEQGDFTELGKFTFHIEKVVENKITSIRITKI